MKKHILFLTAAALIFGAFTACEDVPAPYTVNDSSNGGGSDTSAKELPYSETFSSTLGSFTNYTTSGSGAWTIDYSTAKASGYDNTAQTTTAGTYYLVSPEISLANVTAAHITYDYILRYNKGDENQQLLITDSFDENNPTEGWTLLNQTHTEGSDWSTFSSADYSIPAEYIGKTIRIALRYNTNATSGSTWEVKNFSVSEGSGNTPETPDTPSEEVTPAGTGTVADPYNVAAVQQEAAKLAQGATTSENIYFKGIISNIKEEFSTTYGNGTFYVSDDGTTNNQFYVYRALYLDNKKFTSSDKQIQVGDTVVICGKLTNYNGTLETAQNGAYIYSLKSKSGGSETDGSETIGDATASNGNFENWTNGQPNNWKSTTSASKGTLAMSTDAHGGSYAVEVTGSTSGNNRLAYKELTLPAGTYTMKYYAKAASSTGASTVPGYVPVTDGSVGTYMYKKEGTSFVYTDVTTASWQEVEYTFTLDAETTLNLVIMCGKSPGGNLLVDDLTFTSSTGTVYIQ